MFRPLLLILFRSCRNGQNISFWHENRYHNTPHSTSNQISAYFGVFQPFRPILAEIHILAGTRFWFKKKKKKKSYLLLLLLLLGFSPFFFLFSSSSSCFFLFLLMGFKPIFFFFFFWWVSVLPISFSFFICVLYK